MEQTNSLQNPSVPVEMSVNPPINSPSPSKPVLIILSVIFLVILSSLTTYLFVKSQTPVQTLPQTPAVSPAPVVQTSPTSTPDPTANWKTYTNNPYKFEMKYPGTWTMRENSKPIIEDANIVFFEDVSMGKIAVNLQPLAGGIDAPDMRFEYEDVVLNSYKAKLQKIFFKNQLSEKIYELKSGKNYLSILLMPDTGITFEIFDQILSTFKFTD